MRLDSQLSVAPNSLDLDSDLQLIVFFFVFLSDVCLHVHVSVMKGEDTVHQVQFYVATSGFRFA